MVWMNIRNAPWPDVKSRDPCQVALQGCKAICLAEMNVFCSTLDVVEVA